MNVLLLRAPEENGQDRYEVEFKAKGYVPLSVPVLKTIHVHIDVLKDKIIRGPHAQRLSGIILTSKRAVEAWHEALQSIAEMTQADWRTVPFYVVGAATAAAVSQVCAAFSSVEHLVPTDIRGGAKAGTAERLAEFILAEGGDGPEARRMLYLMGDKNREILPRMLTAGGVGLETFEVYRTIGSSTFHTDLRVALKQRAPVDCTHVWGWVAHFAPSAAAFVGTALDEVFCGERRTLKIAAIGPTTASHLRDVLGTRVDVVSPQPTPDALCSAITAFDQATEGRG